MENKNAEPSKVEASSYYHFATTPHHVAEKYKPKKVDAAGGSASSSSAASAAASASTSSSGASAWNTGNTWEERDLSKWAATFLKQRLVGIRTTDHDIEISEVSTVTGDASILYVRGKKRCGFDLKVKAKWTGKIKGIDVNGEVEFPEVAESEEDYEYRVWCKERTEHTEVARRAMSNAYPQFKDAFSEFRKALIEK